MRRAQALVDTWAVEDPLLGSWDGWGVAYQLRAGPRHVYHQHLFTEQNRYGWRKDTPPWTNPQSTIRAPSGYHPGLRVFTLTLTFTSCETMGLMLHAAASVSSSVNRGY